MDKSCNGYVNYATWIVAFTIKQNKQLLKVIHQQAVINDTLELSLLIKNRVDTQIRDIRKTQKPVYGSFQDAIDCILNDAIGTINYYQIAEKIKDEIELEEQST